MTYDEYVPMPSQLKFHMSPKKYKLYGGAMAGGKSVALCAEVVRLCLLYPGNSVLLARKTLKDLKKTTLRILLELLPESLVASYNKTDGLFVLKNGSEILCSDLEHIHKLKSLNLGAWAIDEASEADEETFLMLSSRLRKNVKDIRYFGLMASNPEPGWLKDRFISKQLNDHIYIPALPKDNSHLPQGYLSDMEATLPQVWRTKYLEGSWDDFGGAVFPPHMIRPSTRPLPEMAIHFTAIDPAISEDDEADETAICTFGIDYDGSLHEVETLSGRWSFLEQVKQLKAVNERYQPRFIGVEAVAYQAALHQVCTREGLPAVELKVHKDKVMRAMGVSRWFEDGRVKINTPALSRQLIEFPKGTHDDLVDACVHCLNLIQNTWSEKQEKHLDKYSGLTLQQIQHKKSLEREFERFGAGQLEDEGRIIWADDEDNEQGEISWG